MTHFQNKKPIKYSKEKQTKKNAFTHNDSHDQIPNVFNFNFHRITLQIEKIEYF